MIVATTGLHGTPGIPAMISSEVSDELPGTVEKKSFSLPLKKRTF
jgi:hypothetical protein